MEFREYRCDMGDYDRPMSNDDERQELAFSISQTDTIVDDVNARHIAFVGWVLTAGCYGYAAATFETTANGTTTTSYPEYAGLFLLLGLALGVAFSATIVTMIDGGDSQ
jgi:hypothetical protein